MPVTKVKHTTDTENHFDRVILQDHFGKQHVVMIHPFEVRDKQGAPGEYEVVTVDLDAVIAREEKLMLLREKAYFEHLMKHHPDHPKLLSHPDHPLNAGKSTVELQSAIPSGDCKDCE